MTMIIERERAMRPRFGVLHEGMLAFGFGSFEAANPNVCFATSAMGVRAEGDEEKEPEEEPGKEPTGKCRSCSSQNEENAKFCDQCGKSMAAERMEEEPPPSSKPKPDEKKAARFAAPAKMSATASLASILGAAGESPLELKTAALGLRHVRDTAAGVTGQTDPGSIVGALLTMPERLATADAAVADAKKSAITAERTTRRDLASRLNKLGLDSWPRTLIFADRMGEDGKPVSPPPLTKTIAAWDLSEFRGYVETFEKRAPKAAPFATQESAAKGAKEHAEREGAGTGAAPVLGADGEPTQAQIDTAKKDPIVIKLFGERRASGQATAAMLDVLAAQHVKTCARLGLPMGGA